MAGSYIEHRLRPCYIWVRNRSKKKKALFHEWVHKHNIYTNEEYTVGIVELEDGKVFEIKPGCIEFVDNPFIDYAWDDEKGE